MADIIKPFSEIVDDDLIKIYQGRPAGFDPTVGYSQSWSRDPKFARNYAGPEGSIFTKEVSGAEWMAAVEETAQQGAVKAISDKAKLTGLEEGRFIPEFAKDAQLAGTLDEMEGSVPSITPPVIGDASYPQAVAFNKWKLGAAIEDVLGGVRENYGKIDYVNLTDELVEGTTKWFEVAKRRMATFRASAAYHAQEVRDFGLHDYGDRFAIDALIGIPWNFHLWSTRTLLKTPQRAARNLPFLNRYAIYRKAMERYHSDLPPWLRQKLNSDELLGIHTDNPFLFDIESAFMPFVNMMGGFDDPDRRVNWWSKRWWRFCLR